MSKSTKPTANSEKTTGPTVTPSTESESLRRLRSTGRIAKADSPIYSSGLTMTSVPALRQSTPSSPSATGGTSPAAPAAEPTPKA